MKQLAFLIITLCFVSLTNAQESKVFNLQNFDKVVIEYPAKIKIIYGQDYSIKIIDSSQTKTNILLFDSILQQNNNNLKLASISVLIKDSTLFITNTADLPTRMFKVHIIITMPQIKYINVNTGALVEISGDFNLNNLFMDIQGACSIKLFDKPKIKHLKVIDEGASYIFISLKNTIETAFFDISGASFINSIETPIKHINIIAQGASLAKIWAIESMTIDITGMSYIFYKGNPHKKNINSDGLSIVKHVD